MFAANNSERFLLHLRELLEAHKQDFALAKECVQELQTPEVLFHPGGEMSTVHVYRKYADRATDATSAMLPLAQGHQNLLDALHQEREPAVRFVAVTTRTGTFLLFTDALITRIIGILSLGNSLADVHCMSNAISTDFSLSAPLKRSVLPDKHASLCPY